MPNTLLTLPTAAPTLVEKGITLSVVGGLPQIDLRLTDIPVTGNSKTLARIVATLDGKEVWAFVTYDPGAGGVLGLTICQNQRDVRRAAKFRPWQKIAAKSAGGS